MRDHVLIYVNGQRHEVRGGRAFRSLSDFLRHDLGLIGTKVVCAEGDCGSCSVFLGMPGDGRIAYATITSCIQFLFQLDCTHIVTIEGLKHDGELSALQEAMVRSQGAQCGFCTPGFIVAMSALHASGRPIGQDDVRAACVGNLCRCTGYEPIISAGVETDWSRMRSLDELYPPREILGDLALHQIEPVLVRGEGKSYFKPVTIESAAQFRLENPHAVIVAGGTDVGVQINKGFRDPHSFMSLSGLPMLRGIGRQDDMLIVGASARLSELERACADVLPEYARMLGYFGSPPIRNAGTLGGNIANGSPIGDTMPALYVLNGEIELCGTKGPRRVNINEFYTGYRQTVMAEDELITRVLIPLPRNGESLKLYKISRRKDLDISAFTAAFWMRSYGDTIDDIRIAYGGVGSMIVRLRQTEAFLRGRAFSEEAFDQAAQLARSEVRPISDVRGSLDYRAQLAENVMRKFLVDLELVASDNGNGQVT